MSLFDFQHFQVEKRILDGVAFVLVCSGMLPQLLKARDHLGPRITDAPRHRGTLCFQHRGLIKLEPLLLFVFVHADSFYVTQQSFGLKMVESKILSELNISIHHFLKITKTAPIIMPKPRT
jgi:hypothetical protein